MTIKGIDGKCTFIEFEMEEIFNMIVYCFFVEYVHIHRLSTAFFD